VSIAFESPHPQPDLDAVREALLIVLRKLDDGPARADELRKLTALDGYATEWLTVVRMTLNDKLIERAPEDAMKVAIGHAQTVLWQLTPRGRRALEQLEGRQYE
jgi:hypothetical protein